MAKDIKAVKCPHCGSIYKTETKPDFYRCQNCGTEYFIDSDDVHIYHHHQPVTPVQSSAQVNTKLPVYILIGAVAFIVIMYFVTMLFQPKSTSTYNSYSTYKTPRMQYGSIVYMNTATGNPVYLRTGADQIDKGNNKTEMEMHAQFNDPITGKVIVDRVIDEPYKGDLRCDLKVKTYQTDLTYAIGCNATLFQLDTRNNNLIDITQSIFKTYPQLSSGVARLEFDYDKDMINVMNNEGDSYHYFPTLKKLVSSNEQAEQIWQKQFDRHFFEFGYLGSYFDEHKYNQLIENKYSHVTGQLLQRNLTPGRRYFDPKIIYQDGKNLLITVHTTAASNAPISIQNIDVTTGKINWVLPPDQYYLYSTIKCKQGFAIEYRKDEEADYAHGVLVISNTGKLIHNYQLGRTE
ncbi:hypothetical protein HH214_15705 [Mucilaginibacter robiniae]|uniref:Uncharacterized protein n=2 Tax=Mucilaginibacter robiniae TaxID=2728022 RepID=A0A7L5E548_9SPHI|nr:hypothetical protein HH214_15705 [Mucilaginibacter robiniae]